MSGLSPGRFSSPDAGNTCHKHRGPSGKMGTDHTSSECYQTVVCPLFTLFTSSCPCRDDRKGTCWLWVAVRLICTLFKAFWPTVDMSVGPLPLPLRAFSVPRFKSINAASYTPSPSCPRAGWWSDHSPGSKMLTSLEKLRAQAQHQPAVHPSRFAQKIVNSFSDFR